MTARRARIEHSAGGVSALALAQLAFDYEGRAYRFGAKLAEDESRRVLELLW